MTNPDHSAPRYEHDCEKCAYLGQHDTDDIYFCMQEAVGIPTIVRRHSSEPADYYSGYHLFDTLPDNLKFRAQEELAKDPDVQAILTILKDAGGELHIEQLEHRYEQGEGRVP